MDRIIRPALRGLASVAARLTPRDFSQRSRAMLVLAGYYEDLNAAEFVGLRILSLVVFTAIAFTAPRYIAGGVPQARPLLFVLFIFIGLVLPVSLLSQRIESRKERIRKSLPDMIDLLIVSVEAGMGFDGAVTKVVEKTHGPLADELARVLQGIRLGMTRSDALKEMSERTGVDEVKTFVAAVYQADQLGMGMARILRVQSETVRTVRLQKIREEAGKLAVKILFPLVFFEFPALFVVLLGPAFMHILKMFK